MVEYWAFGRGNLGSKPHVAVSKLGQFRSPHFVHVFRKRLTSRCSLLSGVTVSMPREVKNPTGKWKKPVVNSLCFIELVILISKLYYLCLPPSLAAISCKGSISSSIGLAGPGHCTKRLLVWHFICSRTIRTSR